MKLILGTANFNLNYGISKNKFKFSKSNNLNKLLKKNIKYIDTAEDYNNLKKVNKIKGKFNFFSKFKLKSNNKKKFIYVNNILTLQIRRQLKTLNISKFYGIMFHNSNDIFSFKNEDIKKIVKNIKKHKLARYIGVSVYSPMEIKKINKIFKPDFIQFPVNIFDKRFISKKNINFFKKNKIKMIARSCFLKGLLLKKNFLFSDKKDKYIFDNFKNWCKKKNISQLHACINFIKNIKQIDFLVVGIDNLLQMRQIINVFNSKKNLIIPKFKDMSLKTVDPRKWN